MYMVFWELKTGGLCSNKNYLHSIFFSDTPEDEMLHTRLFSGRVAHDPSAQSLMLGLPLLD